MRLVLCFIALALSALCNGQEIVHITPEQLLENIKKTEGRATVIKYWIPNCAAAKEIVAEFKQLEDTYSDKIDFYFIGITNKDSLVELSTKANSYTHKIYVADNSVNSDITLRKERFSLSLCKLLDIREKDFIALYLDKDDKVIYRGNALEIKEKQLKKLMR